MTRFVEGGMTLKTMDSTSGRDAASSPPDRDDTAITAFTVCICTHNRSRDVADCLDALLGQDVRGVTILVIDSASSGPEKAELERLTRGREKVRLISLEKSGLSLARNEGVDGAATPWIAFIDDDVVVAPDWIEQARRLIESVPDGCAVIGGRVDPIFPDRANPKLGFRWAQLLSLIQVEGERIHAADAKIVGSNCLFRRDALLAAGAFPVELGRVGKNLASGEEKLAVERLRDMGRGVTYSDRLKVGHKIPRERLHRSWAARRAYWDGISDQKIRRMLRRPAQPLKLAKIAAWIPVLGLLYPVRSARHEFFLRFWYDVGYLREFIVGAAR